MLCLFKMYNHGVTYYFPSIHKKLSYSRDMKGVKSDHISKIQESVFGLLFILSYICILFRV